MYCPPRPPVLGDEHSQTQQAPGPGDGPPLGATGPGRGSEAREPVCAKRHKDGRGVWAGRTEQAVCSGSCLLPDTPLVSCNEHLVICASRDNSSG